MKSTRNRIGKKIAALLPDDSFRGETDTEAILDKGKNIKTLEDYLIQLANRKEKSTRETALCAIVQALTTELEPEFVEKNIVTVAYECLFGIRKGNSAKELQLSLQAIGLLEMIVEDKDSAHEVYQDLLPVLSHALESESNKLKILNSLAIITFFGASSLTETETVMKILWKFLEADSNGRKLSATVLGAAISAWSFLLTTIERWSLKHRYWQGAVSYFSNLLEVEEDESVCAATAEALALIFEIDCLENFSTDSKKQELKDYIIEKLKGQSMKASEEREKQEAVIDVLKFFEAGKSRSLGTYVNIGEYDELMLSTWCERLQLKFFKSFLGEVGFVKHMRKNEKLQAIFHFRPRVEISTSSELYTPHREENKIMIFQPAGVEEDGCELPMKAEEKQRLKKMTKSPNSFLNKARTRLLNKKRMLSQQENGFSHTVIDD